MTQQESHQLWWADGKASDGAVVSLYVFSAHILTPICLGKSRLNHLGVESYCAEAYVCP